MTKEKATGRTGEIQSKRAANGPDSTRVKVGRAIRSLRRSREMKLLPLATLTGIDAGSLSRIERGLQGWTPEVLDAIANGLGVHVSAFFESSNPSASAWSAGTVLIPQFRAGGVALENTGPLVPFPRAWLPKTIRTAGIVALNTQDRLCDYLVDTNSRQLEDGKLFAFSFGGRERVRRVFLRYDNAVRLMVDAPSPETPEEVVPPTAVPELVVIGRVVWGGGPL